MRDVSRVRIPELRDSEAPWLKGEFLGEGRLAKEPANPAYPEGLAVDFAPDAEKSCAMSLTYPAPQIGKWIVKCERCSYVAVVTAAGQPDDPVSIRIPCRPKEWRT